MCGTYRGHTASCGLTLNALRVLFTNPLECSATQFLVVKTSPRSILAGHHRAINHSCKIQDQKKFLTRTILKKFMNFTWTFLLFVFLSRPLLLKPNNFLFISQSVIKQISIFCKLPSYLDNLLSLSFFYFFISKSIYHILTGRGNLWLEVIYSH